MHIHLACAVIALLLSSVSCQSVGDFQDVVEGQAMRGTAVGLLEPVALELVHEQGREVLVVADDGDFSFSTLLAPGASYQLESSDLAPCVLEDSRIPGQSGAIRLSLTCDGVTRLSSLALSNTDQLEFDPDTLHYDIEVPLLHQEAVLTAKASHEESTIWMADEPAVAFVERAQVTLQDRSRIALSVSHPSGLRRDYSIGLSLTDAYEEIGFLPTPEEDGEFGHEMAVWGDTLAVAEPSAHSDAGAVHIFRRAGDQWVKEGIVRPAVNDSYDRFGHSVALWEDTLVVGAPFEDSDASGIDGPADNDDNRDSGAVYVFQREDSAAWVQVAYIKASNSQFSGRFGHSVTVFGDLVVVGAPSQNQSAGAAHLFRRLDGVWSMGPIVTPDHLDSGDDFGDTVALWGETLVVSAPSEDSAATGIDGDPSSNDASFSGAAYIYNVADAPMLEAYLKGSNTEARDCFGAHLAIWGDTIVVSAPDEDSAATGVGGDETDNSASRSGAVYVFRKNSGSWSQEAYIKPWNRGDAGQNFGDRVGLWRDVLVVSVPEHYDTGAVHVLRREHGMWRNVSQLGVLSCTIASRNFRMALGRDSLFVSSADDCLLRPGVTIFH